MPFVSGIVKEAPWTTPTALQSTSARWDTAAELRADSLDAFDAVLRTIRQIDGIATTETSLLLSTYK
ncbi:DNA-binding Lrp family transcriptional regulator [Rhodoferax saidenbachensis]|uniref:DNA-binding Lrp family transcriptional regulator n=1 Tax=Rhodoferax saidenbachensis TaxID=1484693 RepID=A0ABU1ZJ12_9BURK|nr:DNA-binding Lrp family transcriptional regulator [Rhodoferax saidenbachensis]